MPADRNPIRDEARESSLNGGCANPNNGSTRAAANPANDGSEVCCPGYSAAARTGSGGGFGILRLWKGGEFR